MLMIQTCFILGFTLAAFLWDVTVKRIPNKLNLAGALSGLLIHLYSAGLRGVIVSIISLLMMFLICFGMYLVRAIGAGDVKWFAALGALSGLSFTLYTLVSAVVLSGAAAIILLIVRKKFRGKGKLEFPLMYAALPGVLLAFINDPAVMLGGSWH